MFLRLMMRNLNNQKPTNVIHDNPQPPDDALIQKFLEAKQDEALLKQLFIQISQIKCSLATWKAIIAAVLLDETKRNVILIDCLKYSFGLLSDHSIQEQYEIISIIDYIVRLIPNNSGEQKDVNKLLLYVVHDYEKYLYIDYWSHEGLKERYLELIRLLIEKNHVSNATVHSIYFQYQLISGMEKIAHFAPEFFRIIMVIPRVKIEHALHQGHEHFEEIILDYRNDPTVRDYILDLEKEDHLGNTVLCEFKDWWLQSEVRKQFYAGKTQSVNEEKTSQRSPLLNNHLLANLQNTNNHDQSVPRTEVYYAPLHRTVF